MVNNKQNGGGYLDWFKKAPGVEKKNDQVNSNQVNSNQVKLDEVTSEKVEAKKPSTLMSYLSSFPFFNSKPTVPETPGQLPLTKGGKRKTKKAKKSKKSKTSKAKK
jgi:hypothetical protein